MANSTTIVIRGVDETKAAFDSATRNVGSLSSAIGKIPGFGPLAASLSAFASLGAFQALIGNTISFGAEMQRASLRTGSSVEALGALGKVAKLSQTDIGSVEASLVRLNKALAGADDESKAAGHAIAAIGLDVDQLKAKDPAQAMLDIAKALDKWADDGSKTALVMEILGKNGAEMLPMLKDLAQQTDLNGKMTQEQAERAAKMEKQWIQLTSAGGTYAKSIAMEIIPTLSKFLEQMTEGTRIAGGFGNALWEFGVLAMGATGGISGARAEVEKLNKAMADGRAQNLLDMGSTDLSGTEASLGRAQRRLEFEKLLQRQDALQNSGSAYEDPRDVLSRRKESLSYSSRVPTDKPTKAGRSSSGKQAASPGKFQDYDAILMERVARALEQTDIAKATELAATLEKLDLLAASGLDPALVKAVRDDLTGATKAAADETKRLNDLLAATPTVQLEKARDDMIFLTQALEAGRVSEEKYIEAVVARLDTQNEHVKETLDPLDQYAVEAAKNIQDAFADFLFDPFEKGMEGMLVSFGNVVKRMIANAVAADLNNRLFGDISAGKGVGGWVGSGLNWLKGAFGGTAAASSTPLSEIAATESWIDAGGLASFAVGTDYVPRDMVARIHKGERILTAEENRAGAGNVTIHVNVSGASGNVAEVRRAAGQGAREAMAALAGARRYV